MNAPVFQVSVLTLACGTQVYLLANGLGVVVRRLLEIRQRQRAGNAEEREH
jgi:hypothetical protein